MNDFRTSVLIATAPAAAFDAVLDIKGWWNAAIDGAGASVGDEFGFEVAGLHRTRIRVVDLVPGRRVEWLVTDNEFGFVADHTEWVGDRIVFDLAPHAGGTEVTFTQHGLTPGQECFDVCSNAWNFFLRDSLRGLAEHGVGAPESDAGQAAPADLARAAVQAFDAATVGA